MPHDGALSGRCRCTPSPVRDFRHTTFKYAKGTGCALAQEFRYIILFLFGKLNEKPQGGKVTCQLVVIEQYPTQHFPVFGNTSRIIHFEGIRQIIENDASLAEFEILRWRLAS